MRAVKASFFQMAVTLRRDRMLFACCLAPVLAGLFFRFVIPFLETVLTDYFCTAEIISPYYKLIDLILAMLSPAMFCFVSAMICLEERDEKAAVYLFITPLGKTGYLFARFGIPAGIAFLVTMVLLPAFKLTAFTPPFLFLLAAGGTLQGMIVALLVLTFSSNKLEGMAVAKLATLTIFGAAVPFFIRSDMQYAASFLPSFWIGRAVSEGRPLSMLSAFALSVVWIGFLLKRYLRSFC